MLSMRQKKMNHYEILGVAKNATDDEIKKSYKKLASKHHPDRPSGNTQKFQEIQAAYDILSTPQKRAQYDMELEGGGRHQFHFSTNDLGGEMPDDFADLLRRQFGFDTGFFGRQGGRFRHPPQRNQDVRIMIQVDLIDTLKEQTKTLAITLPGGEKENIEITIPRGVQDGETIRYQGLGGHTISTVPRADLYVQFLVRRPFDFEQSGVDLYKKLTVNCLEAIVGCNKEVVGLDGKKFNLTVPPGSQYGAKFGIADAGLYVMGKETRGRLVIVLDVYVPKELTDSQLKMIKDIIDQNS